MAVPETNHTPEPIRRTPLRLWPGVAIATIAVVLRFIVPVFLPEAKVIGIVAGLLGAVLIALWWLFLSRAPWMERIGAIALMVAAVAAVSPAVDRSIRGGAMGMMLPVLSAGILGPALVVWAVISRGLTASRRRAALVAVVLVACGSLTLLRTDGVTGDGSSQLQWRWTPTAEQKLLARGDDVPRAPATSAPVPDVSKDSGKPIAPAPPDPAAKAAAASATAAPVSARKESIDPVETPAEWPGFRGPRRDGVVRNLRIETDWAASPPVQMWRKPIGPGWSSFAVSGDLFYTQEQRGEEEIVACYRLSTGEPVWRHGDPVRFWESNAGPGPRGTPTLHKGRVYAFGATGMLNALDARTGAVVWSRNVAADTGRRVPDWGFASSPLVVGDVVVVAASGTLAAYDLATGNRQWTGPSHGGSYSSPQLATLDGVTQVLLLGGPGAISVAPSDGTVLWKYTWMPGTIVQPALTPDGDVLVNAIVATGGVGIRRLAVSHESKGWHIEERWTSNGLKPYFNDSVLHKGHAYGFDGSILACIDLEDGTRKWKGGRYGSGQMVLLADQDLLLVLSEDGELALVNALPDRYTEVARVPGIEGKTWNHPAVAGDVLLTRNGEHMAAFRLPRAKR